ncbi:hypothetical protein Emed_005770 [Eimeria media]
MDVSSPGVDRAKATLWAAVLSTGEVVVFFRTEQADAEAAEQAKDNCITILSRFSLASWLAGGIPKEPTALAEAGQCGDSPISSIALQLPKGCGCWLDAPDTDARDHEKPGSETFGKSTTGLFAFGWATTRNRGCIGGLAFLWPHLDVAEGCSDPTVRNR